MNLGHLIRIGEPVALGPGTDLDDDPVEHVLAFVGQDAGDGSDLVSVTAEDRRARVEHLV
jgi:hypothetical protein